MRGLTYAANKTHATAVPYCTRITGALVGPTDDDAGSVNLLLVI